jgi:SM-20-related protein
MSTLTDSSLLRDNAYLQPDWPALLHDLVLDQLADAGWVALDNALPDELFLALCQESVAINDYQTAGLVQGGQQIQIRSDQTRWLASTDLAGQGYLTALASLSEWLNRCLYSGIRHAEAHYACYQTGQFYAIHRDNPIGSNVRAVSTVLYLNQTWNTDWGGQLRIEDRQGMWHQVDPIANRLMVFDSDLRHEVLPATHTRRSIAGWLRRDDPC